MSAMQLQICAVLIMIMLFSIVFSKKMLESFVDHIFMLMMILISLDIVLDTISTYMVISYSDYTGDIYYALSKVYLACMVASMCCIYLYIAVDAAGDKRRAYKIIPLAILPAYFGICCIMVQPVDIRIEDTGIFFANYAATMAYGVSILYLCLVIVVLQSSKSRMKRETREAARMVVAVFIAMIVVEKLNSNLRVESLSFALMAVFIYMNLKNADEHIDKTYGVFNQDAFEYYLRDIVEEGKQAYVLYLGFDEFKAINATFGYANGRELFKKVVDALAGISDGKVFRLDAYEIACVYKGSASSYRNYRSAVRYKIREEYMILDAGVKLPVYIVEIPIPADCFEYAEVYAIMKQSMEQLVASGQNYILIRDEHFAKLRRHNSIRRIIEQAIDSGQVDMWYQPIYNMETDAFDSAEALIRMCDEEGRVIPAATVVSIADQTGLILKLGDLIFQKVFAFMKDRQLLGSYLKKVHINLSGVQCANEGLVAELTAQMSRYGIAPAYVNLEIREKAEHMNDSVLRNNMQSLIAYGSSFAIDDYGKGYANLEAVMEWPIAYVKLDRELVHIDKSNPKAEQALIFVLQMAKELGLKVVAKGVESEADFIRMRDLHVDYIQGFYLARVLDEADFLEFLEKPLIMKAL